MAVLSSASFLATFPDGTRRVVLLEPQHCCDIPGSSLNDRAVQHGKVLATQKDGQWFDNQGEPIENLRTIALLERASSTEVPACC